MARQNQIRGELVFVLDQSRGFKPVSLGVPLVELVVTFIRIDFDTLSTEKSYAKISRF